VSPFLTELGLLNGVNGGQHLYAILAYYGECPPYPDTGGYIPPDLLYWWKGIIGGSHAAGYTYSYSNGPNAQNGSTPPPEFRLVGASVEDCICLVFFSNGPDGLHEHLRCTFNPQKPPPAN
jgi:hypothetical protein